MRKFIKIFVITVVFLVPVIVFLFLKQFGSNEFVLPVYYEEGNPLAECQSEGPHILTKEFIANYANNKSVLLAIDKDLPNEFAYDLENILDKYPEIAVQKIKLDSLSEDTVLNILNCELVLGEERYINEPIYHKYVLIDANNQVRGYFLVDQLDEIQRLDMELDILLNY